MQNIENKIQKLQDSLRSLIAPTDTIIIGCSGGPDSVCLVHVLTTIFGAQQLLVAHFNHQLRGDESDADEAFVQHMCERYTLHYRSASGDIAAIAQHKGKSIELTARECRHQFFDELRITSNAKYIMTAHHLDDRIETLLFHIIRGTGIAGLLGIPKQSGHIMHPLLDWTKDDIYTYLILHKLDYRTDLSNTDTRYTRNIIRAEILPILPKIHPNHHKTMGNFFETMEDLHTYIAQCVSDFTGGNNWFLIRDFQALHPFLQREVLLGYYRQIHHGSSGISRASLQEFIDCISDPGNNTQKELHNMKLEKRSGIVYITSLTEKIEETIVAEQPKTRYL